MKVTGAAGVRMLVGAGGLWADAGLMLRAYRSRTLATPHRVKSATTPGQRHAQIVCRF
jgi:hypothetical protein